MNAPCAVVFLIGPDWSKGPSRPKPYQKPKPESWRPARTIPQLDRQALNRRADEFRKATQAQVAALRVRPLVPCDDGRGTTKRELISRAIDRIVRLKRG